MTAIELEPRCDGYKAPGFSILSVVLVLKNVKSVQHNTFHGNPHFEVQTFTIVESGNRKPLGMFLHYSGMDHVSTGL